MEDEMDPETFLNQPIKVIAPDGYPACLDCGRYFHHKLIHCPSCGKKIIAWKEISIADFIKKTAVKGSGVLNTLFFYLKHSQGAASLFADDFIPEHRAIYDFAKNVCEQTRKEKK